MNAEEGRGSSRRFDLGDAYDDLTVALSGMVQGVETVEVALLQPDEAPTVSGRVGLVSDAD
jgi:hypothetical protein